MRGGLRRAGGRRRACRARPTPAPRPLACTFLQAASRAQGAHAAFRHTWVREKCLSVQGHENKARK